MEAEPVEQEEERQFEITEPVSVTSGNRSIIALLMTGFSHLHICRRRGIRPAPFH